MLNIDGSKLTPEVVRAFVTLAEAGQVGQAEGDVEDHETWWVLAEADGDQWALQLHESGQAMITRNGNPVAVAELT